MNNRCFYVAICEDNVFEAELLRKNVVEAFEKLYLKVHTDIFSSGEGLLNSENQYDLMFIDCLLPGVNGIETAVNVRKKASKAGIIYTTAYIDYAVDGYKTNALRYLLKPIDKDELYEAISSFVESKQNTHTISVNLNDKEYYISTDDILYLEVSESGKGSIIRTIDENYASKKPLIQFEEEIRDTNFFRTSKQFIVNAKYIVSKDDNILSMQNGEFVTVSKRKSKDFNTFFIKFLKKDT